MSRVFLSEAEKLFILHGVQDDLRVDGRDLGDIRPITVETDLVPGASGSAHLRLANTDILVGVKAEIEEEDRGRIVFSVDCSANATPEFEGRGGDALVRGRGEKERHTLPLIHTTIFYMNFEHSLFPGFGDAE